MIADDKTQTLPDIMRAILDGILPETMARIQADAELSAFDVVTGTSALSTNFGTINDVLVTSLQVYTPSAATAVTLAIGSRTPVPIPAGFVPLLELRARIRPTIENVTLTWSGGGSGSLIAAGMIVTTKGKP